MRASLEYGSDDNICSMLNRQIKIKTNLFLTLKKEITLSTLYLFFFSLFLTSFNLNFFTLYFFSYCTSFYNWFLPNNNFFLDVRLLRNFYFFFHQWNFDFCIRLNRTFSCLFFGSISFVYRSSSLDSYFFICNWYFNTCSLSHRFLCYSEIYNRLYFIY